MNFLFLLKIFSKLNFAIYLLVLIAISSSLGCIIEQDKTLTFYKEIYPTNNRIFHYEILFFFKLNEIYKSWWFLLLLFLLAISLSSCTITTQFPIVSNSKFFFFKEKTQQFKKLPFFVKLKNFYYLKEKLLIKLQEQNYFFYQKRKTFYAYKGLIGRISPILVHVSLIIILASSFSGAFVISNAEQILPKGEISHIQNYRQIGQLTKSSPILLRCNDFWIQYNKKKIYQFYSNLSLLDNSGNEIITKTLSVNKPLKNQFLDIYQSDWNIPGIRLSIGKEKTYQYPLFFTTTEPKIWITWINFQKKNYTLLLNRSFSSFFLYDNSGNFLKKITINKKIFKEFSLIEFIYSTGLLIKSNPSTLMIYLGFFILLLTTLLSYFPYNQLWITNKKKMIWIAGMSNRGKIGFEIELENFLRKFLGEKQSQTLLKKKNSYNSLYITKNEKKL